MSFPSRFALFLMLSALSACSMLPSTPVGTSAAASNPAAANNESTAAASEARLNTTALTAEIVRLTNVARQEQGLSALQASPSLAAAAQKHAEDMASNRFLEHEGSDGSNVGQRVQRESYEWSKVAENVAYNQRGAADVMEGWLNSPPHRRNILNGDVTEIGVGYALTDSGEPYYVQVFASPL